MASCVFICSYNDCTKTFTKKSRLNQHILTHTGDRPYECLEPGCGKSYVRAAHLKRHKQTTHGTLPPVLGSFKCTEEDCESIYCSQDALKKHVKLVHQRTGKYNCEEENCNEVFRKRCQLRAHVYWHKGVLPFQCEQPGCAVKFAQKHHLERHRKIHEGYKCQSEGCLEIFPLFSLLRKHMKQHRKREHLCQVCHKVFPRPGLLQTHFQIHTDSMCVLRCPKADCGRLYQNLRNLTAHLRVYHDGQRIPCSQEDCSRTFASKQKLKQHLKLHDPNIPKKKHKGHSKGGARKQHLITKLTGVPTANLKDAEIIVLEDCEENHPCEDVLISQRQLEELNTSVKAQTDVIVPENSSFTVQSQPLEESIASVEQDLKGVDRDIVVNVFLNGHDDSGITLDV